MKLAYRASLGLLGVCSLLSLAGCSSSASLSTRSGTANAHLYAVDPSSPEDRGSSKALDEVHLNDGACEGLDLKPVYGRLALDNLVRFLEGQGVQFEQVRARDDLHYLDLKRSGQTVRLRVATLKTPREAARDLHVAMLEHGNGSWGVHRANLAVLGPVSDVEDILDFAIETKLACWGVLTIAGRDDNFVIPGGYAEL